MPDSISKNRTLTEEDFTSLLPDYLQKASRLYFTPIHIARIATQWLTETGKVNVLDIGAGIGKFCITGAQYSNSHFYGVEYRYSLVKLAKELMDHYEISNATILHADIVKVDFSDYDAFYLYNPFFENFLPSKRLNNEVRLTGLLYCNYLNYTQHQLGKTKPGTRLVTFHGNNFEVPDSFEKIKQAEDGKLKLWIRK
jgi:hypothetical protein